MITCNQIQALDLINSGKNLFISGNAGSGKTHIIKKFAEGRTNVILTATTGIAAINIGGETIHRFLGLGIETRKEAANKIINKWDAIRKSSKPWDKNKWDVIHNLKTLVIDEVSMLRRDQFELIDLILNTILERHPFGGLQLILCGDFLQLPPVISNEDLMIFKDLQNPYCFQSELWESADIQTINLNTNYRQSDPEFLDILNNIRVGKIDKNINDILLSRLNTKLNTNMVPIKLFPYKVDVFKENIRQLHALPGIKYCNDAVYSGNKFDVEILKKESQAEDKLHYCDNAQIVMLVNDKNGRWANGTMAKIKKSDNPIQIEFENNGATYVQPFSWERKKYKSINGKIFSEISARMTQYPFKLGFAASVHKSQGLTMDYVETNLSSCFSTGQAYVALSRVKTLQGLKLTGWNEKSILADSRVLKFYNYI